MNGYRAGALHMKSIRLKGRDYTFPGAYFVTICFADRKNVFGQVNAGKAEENQLGQLVRARWLEIPQHFAKVELDVFVVMPNHMHALIHLGGTRAGADQDRREEFGKPVAASLPTIVRTFKAAVTRDARLVFENSILEIWQKNYYERVVRDDKEYADTYRYICENPLRWEMDEENLESTNRERA
jgi:REP element-mobilizing transposase RayT